MVNNFTYKSECRMCRSKNLRMVLKLASLPIGDRYVPPEQKGEVVDTYPMEIMMCDDCGHYQNSGYVNPELIYKHYLSRPATTNPVLSQAYQEYANYLLKNIKHSDNPFAVEAGSNDGAFCSYLQERGLRTLGVEPSPNLSQQANDNGIPTVQNYFSHELAKEIKREHGEADYFITNHTFANVEDLDDFMNGVKHLLARHGVFSMQTHYHMDVIDKNLIENFTHEHLSNFYVKPLKTFCDRHDMELFDVKRVPAKSGSIRCFMQKKDGPNKIEPSVQELISFEEKFGMDRPERHESVASFIQNIKTQLHELLDPVKKQGKFIAAFGTSTGATTFSFNYDLGDLISFFVDDDHYRHHLVSPGFHIPVQPTKTIYEKKSNYVIILAPLYADKIMQNNQDYLKQGGKWIKIWPEFEVIEKI